MRVVNIGNSRLLLSHRRVPEGVVAIPIAASIAHSHMYNEVEYVIRRTRRHHFLVHDPSVQCRPIRSGEMYEKLITFSTLHQNDRIMVKLFALCANIESVDVTRISSESINLLLACRKRDGLLLRDSTDRISLRQRLKRRGVAL